MGWAPVEVSNKTSSKALGSGSRIMPQPFNESHGLVRRAIWHAARAETHEGTSSCLGCFAFRIVWGRISRHSFVGRRMTAIVNELGHFWRPRASGLCTYRGGASGPFFIALRQQLHEPISETGTFVTRTCLDLALFTALASLGPWNSWHGDMLLTCDGDIIKGSILREFTVGLFAS